MSGLSDTVGGAASELSSCVSNLSDTRENTLEMRRTGKNSNDQGTGNSSQLIQGLVQALVGVTNQQNRQVVYLPQNQSAQQAQGADQNNVFVVDNGGQKIDIKAYLQEIIAAEKIADAVKESETNSVEMRNEPSTSQDEKEASKVESHHV